MLFFTASKPTTEVRSWVVMSYLSDTKTGANRKMLSLLNHAATYDIPFSFIFPSHKGSETLVNALSENGYRVTAKEIYGGRIGLLLWLLTKFCRSNSKIISDLVPTPAFFSKKFLWLIHDIRPAYGYKGRVLLDKVYITLVKRVRNFVSISEFSASEIRSLNPKAEVIIWSNGIDKQFWTYNKMLTEEPIPSFLIVGNFEDRKRHLFVLRSLGEHYSSHNAKISITAVGNPGPTLKEFVKLGHDYSEHVTLNVLHGLSDTDLRALYQKSSLVIIPSSYEGFGLTVLEASRSSSRFICSDIPAHREVGNDSYIYFEVDNQEDFIDKARLALNFEPRWWNADNSSYSLLDVNIEFAKAMSEKK